jgi:hypothetical protein
MYKQKIEAMNLLLIDKMQKKVKNDNIKDYKNLRTNKKTKYSVNQ